MWLQPQPFNRRSRLYSGFSIFYYHLKCQILDSKLNDKLDIIQQDLKIVYYHFIKSEFVNRVSETTSRG